MAEKNVFVEVDLDERAHGTIRVDGIDLSAYVHKMEIVADAMKQTTVTLTLKPMFLTVNAPAELLEIKQPVVIRSGARPE